MGRRTVYALRSIGFGTLMIGGGVLVLLLAMGVIRFSWSATTLLTSTITAWLFGTSLLGAIFGLLYAIMLIGNATGAAVNDLLYDWISFYGIVLPISLGARLIAATVVTLMRTTPLFQQTRLVPRHEPR